jgi:hypothetical protein
MRKLIIGVLFTCLFSIGATCGGDGGGSSTSNVGTIGGEGPVNAVPEPSAARAAERSPETGATQAFSRWSAHTCRSERNVPRVRTLVVPVKYLEHPAIAWVFRSPFQSGYAVRFDPTLSHGSLDGRVAGRHHPHPAAAPEPRNSPRPREIEPPSRGRIVTEPQVGGLHHRYRRAA